MENKLIYGKDVTKNVTAIEVANFRMILFKEGEEPEERLYYPWFLADGRIEHPKIIKAALLEGDQPFRYHYSYGSKNDFYEIKKAASRQNVEIQNFYNQSEGAMIQSGITLFNGMKVKDVSVLSFDIEAVGLQINNASKTLIITNTYRSRTGEITKKMFSVDQYANDQLMIMDWCKWVQEIDPSVMVGHNIYRYDLPYLAHCAKGALRLGKNNSPMFTNKYDSYKRVDGGQKYKFKDVQIYGRQVIDTQFLALTYDFKREFPSYGLKPIIKHLGLEKEGRQHYDAAKIGKNWHIAEERVKIKDYAKDDADDGLAAYDYMIPSFFYHTQKIPKTFQQINTSATGSQLNSMFVRAYIQDGHSIPKASPKVKYKGAIVFGDPGIYSNVNKIDVKGMYPAVISAFEVYDKDKDPLQVQLKVVKFMTEYRDINKEKLEETKDKYYSDQEQSIKIVNNSIYGLNGTPGLNFNSMECAALITEKGRDICQSAITWAESNKYIMVNADTDSIAYSKGYPLSEEEREQDLNEVNKLCLDGVIWENDGPFYPKAIIVAEKNYVLWDGKELKYKGSALKDQKKEPALSYMLKEFLNAMLNDKEHELKNIYHKYVIEALNVQDINRWAQKKTITPAVLTNSRAHERKVREALGVKYVQEGDKVWLYPAIDGLTPKIVKGEIVYLKKTGNPKLIPNRIQRLVEDWNHDIDTEHLLKRLFATSEILNNILGENYFLNYALKGNKVKLEEMLNVKQNDM